LKKWIPSVCNNAWHSVRHAFRPAATFRKGVATSTHPPDGIDDRIDAPPPMTGSIHRATPTPDPPDLRGYLLERKNCLDDILKLNDLLQMQQVLLEIGCGDAAAARRIALQNPGIGVIATDLYDGSRQQPAASSGYGQIARKWQERQLRAQVDIPSNLVILRAEADFLRCLPIRAIDTILAINPEPSVGKSFLDLLQRESLSLKIKQGAIQVVILPYSREHEKEADRMGLIFMAMAGYNPESAIVFWERMSASSGPKPPEFLSTHPSDATRIAEMKKALPEAMKYYKAQ